jgi:hypothetical protein
MEGFLLETRAPPRRRWRVLSAKARALRRPGALLGERQGEPGLLEYEPLRDHRPVAPDLASDQADRLAVERSSNRLAPGASITVIPALTRESGLGKRPVVEGETLTTPRTPDSRSSSAETRSRSA